MSDEIKLGDLVMVVRGKPCCGNTNTLGYIFTVSEFFLFKGGIGCCLFCSAPSKPAILAAPEKGGNGYYLSMLKKIDPPDENQFIRDEVEVTA